MAIAASILGSLLQHGSQRLLQQGTAAINLEQWMRETQYNDPSAQMERFRKAGLNPDLIYGQQNLAPHAQLTEGTPQAPGIASAMTQAAISDRLAESQISKNEADAEKSRASAQHYTAQTEVVLKTLQPMLDQMAAQLKWTNEQTAVAHESVTHLQAQVLNLTEEINLMRSIERINDYKRITAFHEARLTSYNADLARKRVGFYDAETTTMIQKWSSEIGLNDAYAKNLHAQTSFLWKTFDVRQNILQNQNTQEYWSAFLKNPMARYYSALTDMQVATLQFLPYQFAGAMFEAYNYLEHDDKGNIIYNKDGTPKVNKSYALYQKNMGIASDVLGLIEQGTASFRNIGSGMLGFRLPNSPVVGFSAAASSSQPSKGLKSLNGNQKKYWNGLAAKANKLLSQGKKAEANKVIDEMARWKDKRIKEGYEPW